MRLRVARCEVVYTGRLTATLAEAVRLIVLKTDGSVLVHDDSGGYKPLNCIRTQFRPAVVKSALARSQAVMSTTQKRFPSGSARMM
jgi:RecB family endonuclease NucS